MYLTRKIKKNDFLVSDFEIYKLSKEQQKKYNGNFVLFQASYSDVVLKENDEEWLIGRLNKNAYEGIFQTELEAFYQVKLVEMQSKIKTLRDIVVKCNESCDIEDTEWHQVIK